MDFPSQREKYHRCATRPFTISLAIVCHPWWHSGLWSPEEKMNVYFNKVHPHGQDLRRRLRFGIRKKSIVHWVETRESPGEATRVDTKESTGRERCAREVPARESTRTAPREAHVERRTETSLGGKASWGIVPSWDHPVF